MAVRVAGRLVFVNTQKTQTVKICTPQNRRGVYEKYYRIATPYVLTQQQMESNVSQFDSLENLEQWLVNDRKAYREPENEVRHPFNLPGGDTSESGIDDHGEPEVGGAVAEVLDILNPDRYSPDDDPWLPQATNLVERAIDYLVREFLDYPYLHRVEHSIHAQLFHILMSNKELAQRVPLGDGFAETQLIHKEWPESLAREGNRRGNFDLAVLSPQLLKGCPSISAFRGGHLDAPIVIEMGLDYDAEHLARDAQKLMNSKPKHGYLIHLIRELPREPSAEKIIIGIIEARLAIKTAYAWTAGRQCVFKLVNDRSITEKL